MVSESARAEDGSLAGDLLPANRATAPAHSRLSQGEVVEHAREAEYVTALRHPRRCGLGQAYWAGWHLALCAVALSRLVH